MKQRVDRVKAAIIGMGRMGKTRFESMIRHGGYEIVAVCDSNAGNLEGYETRRYTDWKQCLLESDADAVIVCTYNSVIPEVVCAALNMGKAVFSEKPPGRNLEDAVRMQDAFYKEKNLVLKFGFNHRYHHSVIEARALVDSGLLGEVIGARGVYGKAGSLGFASEWRNHKEISGGGIMLDQGIHMLDLLYYFMGEFTEIESSVDRLAWKNIATEDSVFSILKTAEGKVASLHSSAVQWRHKFNLDLLCTKGFISLNGLLTSTMSYGEEQISYYVKDLEERTGNLGKPIEHTICFDEDNSWDYEMREFYDAIVKNVPIKQGTIEEAVCLMRMLEKIYNAGSVPI